MTDLVDRVAQEIIGTRNGYWCLDDRDEARRRAVVSIRVALEEAAKVADSEQRHPPGSPGSDMNRQASIIAAAIRALIPQE